MANTNDLTKGNITRHLITMTLPMIIGMLVMQAYNVTDTYFVSKLGDIELAAISFTSPVVMIIWAMGMGIGLGVSATVSKAAGAKDLEEVRQLTTNALRMTFFVVSIVALLGILNIDFIFKMLGAHNDLIPMISSYMLIWFFLTPIMILPMVGNNAIRAMGDTVRPAIIMSIGAVLNIIMDPILIFGLLGFPAMGIAGAAIATVVSRLGTVIASLLIMHYKFHILEFSEKTFSHALSYWKILTKYSVPAILTNLLLPLMSFIVMKMVAVYGYKTVAGTGAGQKIQMFIYSVPVAVGTITVPIIGQNLGANKIYRVKECWRKIVFFDLAYGIASFIFILFMGESIAGQFSEDPFVIHITTIYLMIALCASGFQHMAVHCSFIMNGLGHPQRAAIFNVIRWIPLIMFLAIVGTKIGQYIGLQIGVAVAQVLAAIIGMLIVQHIVNKKEKTLIK